MKVSDQANNLRPRAQVYRAHNAKKLHKWRMKRICNAEYILGTIQITGNKFIEDHSK